MQAWCTRSLAASPSTSDSSRWHLGWFMHTCRWVTMLSCLNGCCTAIAYVSCAWGAGGIFARLWHGCMCVSRHANTCDLVGELSTGTGCVSANIFFCERRAWHFFACSLHPLDPCRHTHGMTSLARGAGLLNLEHNPTTVFVSVAGPAFESTP